jgi:hypothetical protein
MIQNTILVIFCDAYACIQTWHISLKERYMYIVLNIETFLGI